MHHPYGGPPPSYRQSYSPGPSREEYAAMEQLVVTLSHEIERLKNEGDSKKVAVSCHPGGAGAGTFHRNSNILTPISPLPQTQGQDDSVDSQLCTMTSELVRVTASHEQSRRDYQNAAAANRVSKHEKQRLEAEIARLRVDMDQLLCHRTELQQENEMLHARLHQQSSLLCSLQETVNKPAALPKESLAISNLITHCHLKSTRPIVLNLREGQKRGKGWSHKPYGPTGSSPLSPMCQTSGTSRWADEPLDEVLASSPLSVPVAVSRGRGGTK